MIEGGPTMKKLLTLMLVLAMSLSLLTPAPDKAVVDTYEECRKA